MSEILKNGPRYRKYKWFNLSDVFSFDGVESTINYKPKENDLFIVTFPKCGTTWMQHIVMSILRRGKPFKDAMDFFTSTPFLELAGADAVDRMTGPGALKTHLSFHLVPYSPRARYIYVARNPRDCCVSFYYHTKYFPGYFFPDGKFEEFFDIFVKGENEFGDYFDNLLSWYEHRNDSNVHFTTFENLKTDTRNEILKVAKFIGEEYEKMLLEDQKMLEDILYYSSFEYMKGEVNKYFGTLFENLMEHKDPESLPCGFKALHEQQAGDPSNAINQLDNFNFMRKGIVGDWRNHFTEEQDKIMKQRIKEKTIDSDGVMDLWKDLNLLK